jgi:hypothetical protein
MTMGKYCNQTLDKKMNKIALDRRYDSDSFGVDVRRPYRKHQVFDPSHEEVKEAIEEFLAKGGKITKIEPGPDSIESNLDKFFPSYAKGGVHPGAL